MTRLPFTITISAANWIMAKTQLSPVDTGLGTLVPVLFHCYSYELADLEGRLEEQYPHEYYDIGWYRPESFNTHSVTELDLNGLQLHAFQDVLERLCDCLLDLVAVDVGVPFSTTKQRYLLLAFPSTSGA